MFHLRLDLLEEHFMCLSFLKYLLKQQVNLEVPLLHFTLLRWLLYPIKLFNVVIDLPISLLYDVSYLRALLNHVLVEHHELSHKLLSVRVKLSWVLYGCIFDILQ